MRAEGRTKQSTVSTTSNVKFKQLQSERVTRGCALCDHGPWNLDTARRMCEQYGPSTEFLGHKLQPQAQSVYSHKHIHATVTNTLILQPQHAHCVVLCPLCTVVLEVADAGGREKKRQRKRIRE